MSITYLKQEEKGAGGIQFSVDVRSEIAVYRQIENQVMFAITAGVYESGDSLPSVREMATATGVNANTVTKAYRDLELMNLIVTRRGVGVQVAPGAAKLCRDNTLTMVRRHIRMAIGEGLASGMTKRELEDTVQEAVGQRVPAYEPSTWL